VATFKRTSSSGTSFYEVRWWEHGKKKSKSFDRKLDADRFENDQISKARAKDLHDGWNFDFMEVGREWVQKEIRQGSSTGWIKRVKGIVEGPLQLAFSEHTISEITPTLVEKWIAVLLEKGSSRANVNYFLKVLKAILNHEVKMGRIPYNPIGKFESLRTPMEEFQVWSKESAVHFLNLMRKRYESKNSWVYTVYVVALNTGLRAGELWGLRWSDILWNDRLIKVEQTCDRLTRAVKIGTKSRKSRFVPLTVSVLKALETLKLESSDAHPLLFKCGNRPIHHDNFRRDHWEKDIALAVKTLEISDLRFHDLRHTAATLMLRSGLAATEVQQILGHASITTTMRYVHLLGNQSARRASDIFSLGVQDDPEKVASDSRRNFKIVV